MTKPDSSRHAQRDISIRTLAREVTVTANPFDSPQEISIRTLAREVTERGIRFLKDEIISIHTLTREVTRRRPHCTD